MLSSILRRMLTLILRLCKLKSLNFPGGIDMSNQPVPGTQEEPVLEESPVEEAVVEEAIEASPVLEAAPVAGVSDRTGLRSDDCVL